MNAVLERTTHQCRIAIPRKTLTVVVHSNDGHVCPTARHVAAELREAGYRVEIAVDGMVRR